jgi:hypothetical protein
VHVLLTEPAFLFTTTPTIKTCSTALCKVDRERMQAGTKV